jgi:hypothetical protein
MFGIVPLLVYIVMTFAGFHPLVATVLWVLWREQTP